MTTTPTTSLEDPDPTSSTREAFLTLLALAAAGVSPLVIVAASSGLAPMPVLFSVVALPGLAIVTGVLLHARATGMARLSRRLWLGILAGILLTLALDAVRVAGVHLGYLPDSVTMFGNLITAAPPMSEPTPVSYTLGAAYHLFNGIGFGVVYSILFGRTRWWGAMLFSVAVVEVAMMTLPPMAPKFGPFGLEKFDTLLNGYFLDTLLAHAAMGLALGVIMQHFARHRGILLAPRARSQPATTAD